MSNYMMTLVSVGTNPPNDFTDTGRSPLLASSFMNIRKSLVYRPNTSGQMLPWDVPMDKADQLRLSAYVQTAWSEVFRLMSYYGSVRPALPISESEIQMLLNYEYPSHKTDHRNQFSNLTSIYAPGYGQYLVYLSDLRLLKPDTLGGKVGNVDFYR